jgi:malic enzyme
VAQMAAHYSPRAAPCRHTLMRTARSTPQPRCGVVARPTLLALQYGVFCSLPSLVLLTPTDLVFLRTPLTCRQANNVYVFPAVALAAVLASPRAITDELLLAAAEAVAGLTTPEDAARGE